MRLGHHALEKQRKRLLDEAIVMAVSEGETAALKDHVERIELLGKLSKAQTARHDVRDGLLVTGVLAGILAMMLAVHMTTATELSATVEGISVLATSIELPGKATYGNATVSASVRAGAPVPVAAGKRAYLKLTEIRLESPTARLSLARAGSCDQITVHAGSLYITLLNDFGHALSPSVMHLAAAANASPSSLTICGKPIEALHLRMRVTELALARDVLLDARHAEPEPVIKEGVITVAYDKHELGSSDLVFLHAEPARAGTSDNRLRLTSTESAYRVNFGG